MTAAVSLARSKRHADVWPTDQSLDAPLQPIDLDQMPRRRSLGRRALRSLLRFLIIFGTGVGGTLAWQSYGDVAREMLASSSPQLGWLAPQPAAVAQTAPSMVASAAPATPSPDVQQLATVSLDLAALRQSLDQLAARQEQMVEAIGKMQIVEQNVLNRLPVAAPQPTAAPARKPAPVTPSSPSQAPQAR